MLGLEALPCRRYLNATVKSSTPYSQRRRLVGVAGDRAVTLVWVKRIWRCVPECDKQTWTETHHDIRTRASLTERARKHACRRVGRRGP
jgi:hypothetical protein